jgi:hypothetical protein
MVYFIAKIVATIAIVAIGYGLYKFVTYKKPKPPHKNHWDDY